MPIIKSAIKKVRKDKVRTIRNKKRATTVKNIVRDTRKNPILKNLSMAFSALDKAAKVNLIHKKKAARLKSRLSKLLVSKKS